MTDLLHPGVSTRGQDFSKVLFLRRQIHAPPTFFARYATTALRPPPPPLSEPPPPETKYRLILLLFSPFALQPYFSHLENTERNTEKSIWNQIKLYFAVELYFYISTKLKKRKKWKSLFIFSQTPVEGMLKSLKQILSKVFFLHEQTITNDYSLTGMFGTKRSLRPTNSEGRETIFLYIG